MYFRLRQPIFIKMYKDSTTIDDYLVELETKIAFQEQMIEALNQALIQQQFTLDRMQMQLRHLAEKLQGVAGSNVASRTEETPPPHY